MGNIFAIAQLDMQYTPVSSCPSAVRDVLARRQKKLRLPNGSVVVMTPCAVDASAPPQGFSDLTYLRAQVEIKAKADAAEHETKEALEDDEHPWWYMTAR